MGSKSSKFCHLGDMLSVDGDADAAVEARFELVGIIQAVGTIIIDNEREIV